jgi:hypothetical protein
LWISWHLNVSEGLWLLYWIVLRIMGGGRVCVCLSAV